MVKKCLTAALIILLSTSSFAGKPSLSPSTPGNTPSETQTPGGQNNGTGSPPNKDAPQNNAPIPSAQGISNTSNAGTSIGTAVSAALLTGVAGVGIGAVGNNWVKNKELSLEKSAMEARVNKEMDKVKEGFNSLTLPWGHPVTKALSKKYLVLSKTFDQEKEKLKPSTVQSVDNEKEKQESAIKSQWHQLRDDLKQQEQAIMNKITEHITQLHKNITAAVSHSQLQEIMTKIESFQALEKKIGELQNNKEAQAEYDKKVLKIARHEMVTQLLPDVLAQNQGYQALKTEKTKLESQHPETLKTLIDLDQGMQELEGWNKKTPVELHNLAKKYLENDYVKPEGKLHHHYQVLEKVVA